VKRLRGAAIATDAVLVWTADRKLVRVERAGTHTLIELPFTPLAAHIGAELVAVDDRGSVHRFSHAGEPRGVVSLLESPGKIIDAAVSEGGSRLAILTDHVQVFEHGQPRPWSFDHRREDGWSEHGVDISVDGSALLVSFELRGSGMNLGDTGEGFSITRADGVISFRRFVREIAAFELEMTADAQRVALSEQGKQLAVFATGTMAPIYSFKPVPHVRAIHFDDDRLGVLYDDKFDVLGLEINFPLPEQFDDFVFCGSSIVCMHPELGAWWIDLTSRAS
jgi:hypothetical protein